MLSLKDKIHYYLLPFIPASGINSYHHPEDILILAPTRWKLKRAIRVLNETFDALKLEKHPTKTAMERTEKGFDFFGFHISPEGYQWQKRR
jgi:hypothetical protein